MTSPSDVHVGVLGAGRWGSTLVENLHAPGALAAVADPNPQVRAGVVDAYARGEAALERPERGACDAGAGTHRVPAAGPHVVAGVGLVVSAYNSPRRKSEDLLFTVHMASREVSAVIAPDPVELNIPSSTVRTKPRHDWQLGIRGLEGS